MWNEPSKERLAKIPRLYETENTRLQDKLIHLHFFIGACDWFIAGHSLGGIGVEAFVKDNPAKTRGFIQ